MRCTRTSQSGVAHFLFCPFECSLKSGLLGEYGVSPGIHPYTIFYAWHRKWFAQWRGVQLQASQYGRRPLHTVQETLALGSHVETQTPGAEGAKWTLRAAQHSSGIKYKFAPFYLATNNKNWIATPYRSLYHSDNHAFKNKKLIKIYMYIDI